MPANSTKSFDWQGSRLFATGIQSFDPRGFTVGTDLTVNGAADTYYWMAFKAAPGVLKVRTYTGNNTDNTPISGVGFPARVRDQPSDGNPTPGPKEGPTFEKRSGRAMRREFMARRLPLHLGLGVLLALGLLPLPADAALAYRRQITILGAQVGATGAPHVNFPVLVSITDPTLKLVPNGGHIASALAYDIAFRDAGFALLDWEVEKYDGVAGTLVAWVRIPSLPSGAGVNTIIYLDYGDCSAATPSNTPANVWNAGFRYVYHLSETSGNPVDSTANAIVATRNPNGDATAVQTLNVTGKAGGAIDFTTAPTVPPAAFTVGPPATDTHVSIADGNYAAGTAFTMEAWVKFDTVLGPGGFGGIMVKGRESGTDWIGIERVGTGVASSYYQLPDGNVNGTTFLAAGNWYHVAATFDSAAAPRRRIYVNGVQEGGDNINSAFTTALNTRLGDDSNGNWLDGQMDEVRFSLGVARSPGWILTSYNNQNNPAIFFTVGAESSIAAVTSCGAMQVKSGVYAGNGTAGRPIFVGFQPDVVFVKRDAASYMVVRTSTMPANNTKSLDPAGVALFANGIQSFGSEGFTLGNDVQVNGAGGNYHWVAFQAAAGGLKVGTYTGNNTDNTSIPGVGFQPEYVITLPEVGGAAGTPLHRSSSMIGDTSYDFDATEVGPPANAIQALLADGFEVGTQASVNTNLATYHYIAWNAVAGRMSVGSYVGNGLDDRNLDVVGFIPEWVLTKRTGDARPWIHKPASTGVNTNYSLTTSNFVGLPDDIQQLRPLGFQVGFGPEAFPDRTNDVGVTYHWIAFGPHQPQVNYRSIGTAANYNSFTVSATNGSTLVTGAGTAWKTANRGRGDRIQISGVDYVVAAVDTETQLRLTTPYAGATASGLAYTIARQFTTLAAWETCIDGNPCAFFPVASSSLIADDRSEVGIAYKDSVLAKVDINGSLTDATHTITLTADPGNRHLGVAGGGVVVDGGAAALANILVQDDFVTVEWLEVKGGIDEGVEFLNLSVSPGPDNKCVVRNMLVHNTAKEGILIDDANATIDVYNNIVYGTAAGSTAGIWSGTTLTTGTVRLFNNTVYANTGGIRAAGSNPGITLRNNLSLGNPSGDYNVAGRNAASSNNLASDASGTTHSPAGGGLNNVTATASPTVCGTSCVGFSNITASTENLHLIATTYTNQAVDTGADLSAVMAAFDIDAQLRVVPWDVGADDLSGTALADLAIAKDDGQANEVPGTAVSYAITATNLGPAPVTGATVTDTLPASLTGASWTCAASPGSSCTPAGSGSILDTITLLVGGTATYTLTANVDPFARGSLVNTASVTPPAGVNDPNGLNDSASDTDTLDPSADVQVVKTDDLDPAPLGGVLTYTLTVTNNGPSGATNVDVSDALPVDLELDGVPAIAITPSQGSCNYTVATRNVSCNLGNLGPTLSATVTIKVRPQAQRTFLNTASVTRTETDPVPANNSESETTLVELSSIAVRFFTATSTNQRNVLEWVNPTDADYQSTEIMVRGDAFPTGPGDPLAFSLYNGNDGGSGGRWKVAHDTGALSNGQTFYYGAFAHRFPSLPAVSPGRFVTGRPFDHTTGPVKWAFSTGATALAAPTVGGAGVIATSNDRVVYAMERGIDDDQLGVDSGEWPASFRPIELGGPVQLRSPVVPVTVATSNPVAYFGAQDGKVYVVDAAQGGTVGFPWGPISIGPMVQAAPAGIFTAFFGAFDHLVVGTRDSTNPNLFVALNPFTGAVADSYNNGGGGTSIGIVNGMAAVDYGPPAPPRAYFTSYAGGSTNTLWAFNLAAAVPVFNPIWAKPLGNIDSSPVLRGGRVLVGSPQGGGTIHSFEALLGGDERTFVHGDGQVKGFIFPDRASATGDIYFATDSFVWGLTEMGGVLAQKFTGAIALPGGAKPSTVLFAPGRDLLYVGGSDGKLYELDTLQATPVARPVMLGNGLAVVGAPSLDRGYDLVHVGTEAGIFYAVQIPLP